MLFGPILTGVLFLERAQIVAMLTSEYREWKCFFSGGRPIIGAGSMPMLIDVFSSDANYQCRVEFLCDIISCSLWNGWYNSKYKARGTSGTQKLLMGTRLFEAELVGELDRRRHSARWPI